MFSRFKTWNPPSSSKHCASWFRIPSLASFVRLDAGVQAASTEGGGGKTNQSAWGWEGQECPRTKGRWAKTRRHRRGRRTRTASPFQDRCRRRPRANGRTSGRGSDSGGGKVRAVPCLSLRSKTETHVLWSVRSCLLTRFSESDRYVIPPSPGDVQSTLLINIDPVDVPAATQKQTNNKTDISTSAFKGFGSQTHALQPTPFRYVPLLIHLNPPGWLE